MKTIGAVPGDQALLFPAASPTFKKIRYRWPAVICDKGGVLENVQVVFAPAVKVGLTWKVQAATQAVPFQS